MMLSMIRLAEELCGVQVDACLMSSTSSFSLNQGHDSGLYLQKKSH
jgi:hypothetical protein